MYLYMYTKDWRPAMLSAEASPHARRPQAHKPRQPLVVENALKHIEGPEEPLSLNPVA